LPAPSLVARRRRARARLLRHRRAHLPVPFAADDPRSAALVLRVPAPQNGKTPADLAAKYNGNAEVKAFFASGQVRPICVQSEGTQRALRGHSEAIGGTQWPSEGSQRPVSGTQRGHPRRSEGSQRHSQAIRGHSEAILGNHSQSAALRRTQWQSRGRRDPRRPRWPHRVLSVRCVRVRVRVFAALAGDAWAVSGGGGQGAARGRRRSACCSSRCEPRRLRPCHTTFPANNAGNVPLHGELQPARAQTRPAVRTDDHRLPPIATDCHRLPPIATDFPSAEPYSTAA
jgi:hypothetical protein